MPATRVTKRAAAPVPSTPRRATRSSVREGSASLETPIATAASSRPRRANGRSRSTTPTSSADELAAAQAQVDHLPALQEEITTPRPSEFAPIADATPYYTPRAPITLPDPATVAPIVDASPYNTPRVPVTLPNPSEVAPFVNASPYNTPRVSTLPQSPEVASLSIKSSPRKTPKTPRASVALPQPSEVAPIINTSPFKTPHVSARLPHPSEVAPIADASPYRTPRVPTPKINTPEYLRPAQSSSPVNDGAAVLEDFISQVSLIYELPSVKRNQLLLDLRKEVIRLRKVEAEHIAVQKQPIPASPQSEPSPDMSRSTNNKRARDLRYQMTIARPAAAKAAERAAAERAAAEAAAAEAAKAASPETRAETPTVSSSLAVKTPEKFEESTKSSTSVQATPASPSWGITSLFGSVRGIFSNRPILSPSKQHTSPPRESPAQQSPVQHSPVQESPSQQVRTQRSTQQQRIQKRTQQRDQDSPSRKRSAAEPQISTTPATEEQPVETPRKVRRRGVLPGSLRKPINSRTPPAKPREVNADRRAEQAEQYNERAAERKRLQDQADKIEQERVQAVEEQKKREEEEAARQQPGEKRKRVRVRIDDLKVIPHGPPGTFCLLNEFFIQGDDSDEDDYADMYAKDIVLRDAPSSRPAKKLRLDENVFQPKTPAAQPAVTSPVKQPQPAPEPATPAPNYSSLTQQAMDKQRAQYSQHKPRQPSRLRQVERLSTGSNGVSTSPLQPVTASDLNAPKRPELGTSLTKAPLEDVASSSLTPVSASPTNTSPLVASSVSKVGTLLDLPASKDGYFPACQVEIDMAACVEPVSRVFNRLSNITEVSEPESPSPVPRQITLPPSTVQWPDLKPLASAEIMERIRRTMPVITPEMRAENLKRFADGVAERVRLENEGVISREMPSVRPCPWDTTL